MKSLKYMYNSMTTRIISDALLQHMVESIKNVYNNQGVDAARQLYFG
jgi:hypothetical protein